MSVSLNRPSHTLNLPYESPITNQENSMACFGFLFLSLSFTLILQINLNTAQPSLEYAYHLCLGGNYTANSTFQSNLNSALSSLSSNATSNDTRFYSNTVGRNPDRVYGLFQCRGDVTFDVCKYCVENATQEIAQVLCPYRKEAILYYDMCMLGYSNNSIVSNMQATVYLWNPYNVTDPDRFNPILTNLMNGLVRRASSNSTNMFATGEADFNDFGSEKIYGLVQCTQDIATGDCNRCLTSAVSQIPTCCDNKRGGRVITPSCNFRYEMYPFYQAEASPPVLPPSVPLPPNTNTTKEEKSSSRTVVIIIVPTVTVVVLLLSITICFCLRRKKEFQIVNDMDEISTVESLQLNFETVRAATENFSDANKLGEGGFGSVYKGKLAGGQEIAVKRLSRNSGQGVGEFKNEVLLVAKLQHRNLVRLFGFCLEGDEKILIYEFVPNTSLDHFIFDPIKRTYLDWERRYNIIGGIARGLLYLHEDSRHRIIHRDLKASNILLDAEMNPKIADFGMARLFVVDQTEGNTSRIVGTYGYMAPEYAMHGQFSVKSDVFSFGVLVLEIVTGQKCTSFYRTERAQDLLSYAWRHWKEGTALELIEPALSDRYSRTEVMRCIHIALLCVQEDLAMRPTMASVVLMLNSYSITLSLPLAPAFFVSTIGEHKAHTTESSQSVVPDQSPSSSTQYSINEASFTELYPR